MTYWNPSWMKNRNNVLLCGPTGTEDTFLATGAGGEMGQGPHTGITTYLARRFFTMPIPVTVTEFRSSDKETWPKSPDDFRSTLLSNSSQAWKTKLRHPLGIGDFLAHGGERGSKRPESKGSLTFGDETVVHWYLLPEGEAYDGKGAGGVYWNPTIAVLYDGEVYSWGASRDRFRQFGISRNAVIDRCSIIIEPPRNNGGEGVYPSSSRSRLLWTGGQSLPWARWAREFQNRMPAEIGEALIKATADLVRMDETAELNANQQKRLNAVTRRLQRSWRRLAGKRDG